MFINTFGWLYNTGGLGVPVAVGPMSVGTGIGILGVLVLFALGFIVADELRAPRAPRRALRHRLRRQPVNLPLMSQT
jgi:uncharacterized membrane protein